MNEERQNRADRLLDAPSRRLHHEIDVELVEIETSADLADNDEPERGPYEVRLHSLHAAVVAGDGEAVHTEGADDGTMRASGEVTAVEVAGVADLGHDAGGDDGREAGAGGLSKGITPES